MEENNLKRVKLNCITNEILYSLNGYFYELIEVPRELTPEEYKIIEHLIHMGRYKIGEVKVYN